LENEPAYKRKQMSLEDTPHSSQSQVSRFTLSFEDGNTEIRPELTGWRRLCKHVVRC
jgi:cell division protein FtsZ